VRHSGFCFFLALSGCDGRLGGVGSSETALTVSSSQVAPINVGEALTLPAQRHLLRLTPSGSPVWLLAVQQDGASGHGLGFFRSNDDGQTYSYYAPIQNDPSERDTTDVLAVGNDVALVYSYEGPDLVGSVNHDVWFQWWRYSGGNWTPQPAIRIFDSTSSSTAYYRGEIARDSLGRIWVHAFLMNPDGTANAKLSVSTDGGNSFQTQADLGTFPTRGGGRLLSLGTRMVFVWDGHDGISVTHYRTRNDSDALGTWSSTQVAFNEGIYHGASISAVADGAGGMHFAYKDKNSVLWYRHFDGSSFGAATQVEAQGNWELQPAVTLLAGSLYIFYNRVITTNTDDELRLRVLSGGTLGAPTVMDSSVSFKGYPASVDVLPSGSTRAPCFWGVTPNADVGGELTLYTIGGISGGGGGGGPVDMAVARDLSSAAPRDLSVPRDLSITRDLSAPRDLSAGALLFSDDFQRQIPPDNGLGPEWSIGAGDWYTNDRGIADLDGTNLAAENQATCRDCTVEAQVITFGTQGGLYLRAPSPTSADRYDVVLLANNHVQVRRVGGGVVTVLADAASGAPTVDDWVGLSLTAVGASPVTLTARVNGTTRINVNDASGAALTGAGFAGMWTTFAGVDFDDFTLTSVGAAPPPPLDLSVARDLSAPRDLSTPRDLALASGVLFSDGFNRNIPPDDGLGPNWSISAGDWYTNGHGIADLDGTNLAAENQAACRDCTVQSGVLTFGTQGGIFLRAPTPTSSDRYDFVLLANGHVRIRRVRAGTTTVLGDVAGGAGDLTSTFVTLSLKASGGSTVTLVGSVNGTTRLTVNDSGSSALTAAGYAGLWTTLAGVDFDDFSLLTP
jgi:hypothetical protein